MLSFQIAAKKMCFRQDRKANCNRAKPPLPVPATDRYISRPFTPGVVRCETFSYSRFGRTMNRSIRQKNIGQLAALLGFAFGAVVVPLHAEPPVSTASAGSELFPMPTLGGKQFWADEFFFHQWRIQRNVVTGHCRLLDENNLRHAWGTYAQCRAKLDQIKRQRKLPPMCGKAVVVLHGLFRTRSSMNKLCKHLGQQGGYTVFNVGYPSTRRAVAGHAAALAQIVDNLDGISRIDFVGHSMGNIVIRHYLADQTDKSTGRRPDRRIHRLVMLGPPNQGSVAAMALSKNGLFTTLAGTPGKQLGQEWSNLKGKLATPQMEFGIIAGGRQDDTGFNPLLPGDDDGIVTVANTHLEGAADFVVVRVLHFSMMDDPKVIEYVLRFLEEGHFQPLAASHGPREK